MVVGQVGTRSRAKAQGSARNGIITPRAPLRVVNIVTQRYSCVYDTGLNRLGAALPLGRAATWHP